MFGKWQGLFGNKYKYLEIINKIELVNFKNIMADRDQLSSYEKARLGRQKELRQAEENFIEESEQPQNISDDFSNQDRLDESDEQQTSHILNQQIRQAAKDKVEQMGKQAVNKAVKSFSKKFIIPILEAIGGFFVATAWFWLVLLFIIIIMGVAYAYFCDMPTVIRSAAQFIGVMKGIQCPQTSATETPAYTSPFVLPLY